MALKIVLDKEENIVAQYGDYVLNKQNSKLFRIIKRQCNEVFLLNVECGTIEHSYVSLSNLQIFIKDEEDKYEVIKADKFELRKIIK